MPGKMVKDWDKYHALRKQGKDKTTAAKIANSQAGDGYSGDTEGEVDRLLTNYGGKKKRKK